MQWSSYNQATVHLRVTNTYPEKEDLFQWRRSAINSYFLPSWLPPTPLGSGDKDRITYGTQSGVVIASTDSVNTNLTGLNFRPKAAILYCTQLAAETTGASATGGFSYGFSDGTNQFNTAISGDTAVATTNAGKDCSSTKVLSILSDGTPTVLNEATIVFNADGFTLTFTTTPASKYVIGYWVVGGSDLTNTFVGNEAMPLATGNAATTAPAFKPDFVLLICGKKASAGTATGAKISIGFATSTSKRAALSSTVSDAATTSGTVLGKTLFNTTAMSTGYQSSTVDWIADFVSFDPTGFTQNYSDAPGSAWLMGYLVIKGGQWDCGNYSKTASAAAESVTSMSFTPSAVHLMAASATASNTSTAECIVAVGTATSTTQRSSAAFHHNDAINTVVDQAISSSKVLCLPNPVVNADFTSFNSNGWTITWGQTGSANLVGWFANAGNAVITSPTGTANLLMLMGWGT